MRTGIELIADEQARVRRSKSDGGEGWTQEHDKEHVFGELAQAAACYAIGKVSLKDDTKVETFRDTHKAMANGLIDVYLWPWHIRYWKPSPDNRIRELVKAGQLIASEIDRLIAKTH